MEEMFDGVILDDLIVGQNSFVTISQALAIAPELLQIDTFVNADETVKKAALIDAYERICSMRLRRRVLPPEIYAKHGKDTISMSELDAQDLAALPLRMRKEFIKAQIYEANLNLGGDPVAELRKQGVMSYTVGEVKQFFRTVKPIDFTIGMKALGQIGKYIDYSVGVARA